MWERFRRFLAGRGLRVTAPRRAIVEAAFATTTHFSADQLLLWARQRDPRVSLATVYRTLGLLVESGLVREIELGGDRKVYDPNVAHRPEHLHLICADCGRIVEFDHDQLGRLLKQVAHELGFEIVSHRLQITARCERLRLTGHCPHHDHHARPSTTRSPRRPEPPHAGA
ncbi:MAG: transcriptional repressor [Verrucomicrobia bacterium]|nr:MAG: transcriptional repressor [Verrucomicrobiota bacterium]